MTINPREFLKDWSAREFYHLVLWMSHKNSATNEYHKIMSRKMNSK